MEGGLTLSVGCEGAEMVLRLDAGGEEIASAAVAAEAVWDLAAFAKSNPDPTALGDRLGEILFPDLLRDALQSWGTQALARGGVVRLALRCKDPTLAWLPWELVRVPSTRPSHPFEGFLALHPRVRLFRGMLPGVPALLGERGRRRILFCAADPGTESFARLGWLETEQRAVVAAYAARKSIVDLRTTFDLVPAVLDRSLSEFRPHVLHFAGHGITRLAGGFLVLQGEAKGTASLLDARELARWAMRSETRLVVLSACESDASAECLIEAGVPAVLAMRGTMRDAVQPSFMRTLYGALSDGASIADAVAEARQAMPSVGADWAVPVLRCRQDVRLFEGGGGRAAPPKLPYAERRMVGRERELAEILDGLNAPNPASYLLTGLGGIGKTRLAVEAASEAAEGYPDGVFFVDCEGIREPESLYVAMLVALGVEGRQDQPEVAFLAAMRRTRRLLVLDCCDDLLAAGCSDLLFGLPKEGKGAMIFTARSSRGTSGDVFEIPVDALSAAENPAEDSASVELFIEAAGLSGRWVSTGARRAIGEICGKLDGIPLAIVLCAGHVAALPVEDLRDLVLREPLRTASSGWAGSRHGSVAEAIRRSLDLVPVPDRLLLARLCVFVGGFTWGDAVAVLAGDALDLLDGLKRLTDSSLLRVDRSQERSRFRLLDTVRESIRATSEGDEGLSRRHAQHFAAIVTRMHEEDRGALRTLRPELGNFMAAARFADRCEMPREALRIADELCRTLFEAGLNSDFRELLEMGKRAAISLDDRAAESRLLGLEGADAARVGDEERCRMAWLRRAGLCTAVGDHEGAADALIDLAVQEHQYGDFEACRTLLNLADERLDLGGSDELRATASVMRARLASDRGDFGAAERYAREAADWVARGTRRDPLLFVDLNIGRVVAACGYRAEAEAIFIRVLKEALRMDRRTHASLALMDLSPLHESSGRIALGLLELEAAMRIFEAAQSRYQSDAEARLRAYQARNCDYPTTLQERNEPWTSLVEEVLSRMEHDRPPPGE